MVNATNECGVTTNSTTVDPITVYIRIMDTSAPTLEVPAEMTFYSSSFSGLSGTGIAACQLTETEFLDSLLQNAAFSVSDNCTTDIEDLDFDADFINLSTTCSGDGISTVVMVTVTDACRDGTVNPVSYTHLRAHETLR